MVKKEEAAPWILKCTDIFGGDCLLSRLRFISFQFWKEGSVPFAASIIVKYGTELVLRCRRIACPLGDGEGANYGWRKIKDCGGKLRRDIGE